MDETGASAVEYCLLLAVIAMGILATVTNLGLTISNKFVSFATTIITATGS